VQQRFGGEWGFSLRLLNRVKRHDRGDSSVVVDHGGRSCDGFYEIFTGNG
jgi:hypothetical protein